MFRDHLLYNETENTRRRPRLFTNQHLKQNYINTLFLNATI